VRSLAGIAKISLSANLIHFFQEQFMSANNLTTVTNELIESYGNTARNIINAYRVGNKRAIGFCDRSWASAVKKTGSRLSAEVRGNALAAEKKVTGLYFRGVELTTHGADVAVNKAVELAGKGVEQVATNASRFEKATGVKLHTLAVAAVPAAKVVTQVAGKIEARCGALANRMAGKQAQAKVAGVKRIAARKVVRARKAGKSDNPAVAAPAPASADLQK
jgi:hypothetical protein